MERDAVPFTAYNPPDDPVREAFRNVDDHDWQHLFQMIPDSGHGRFWKAVFAEARVGLSRSNR